MLQDATASRRPARPRPVSSVDVADDLHAARRRSSRRSTFSDVASRSDGAPSGKRALELAAPACSTPGRGRRTGSCSAAGSSTKSRPDVVDVGAQHQQVVGGLDRHEAVAADLDRARRPRRPRSPRPSRSRSGSPRACDGSAGSTVLTLRISGRPRMPWRRVERLASSPARSNQRLLVEQNRCRSRSASASWSSVERLRGLAQHDPAVGLAAGEVAALAVGRRTAHGLDRERRAGLGEPAGDPGVGDRAEVVGVGDEDALVALRRSAARAGRCRAARCRGRRGRAGTTRGRGRLGQLTGVRSVGEELGLAVLQELQRQPVDRRGRRSGPARPWCRRRCGSCS